MCSHKNTMSWQTNGTCLMEPGMPSALLGRMWQFCRSFLPLQAFEPPTTTTAVFPVSGVLLYVARVVDAVKVVALGTIATTNVRPLIVDAAIPVGILTLRPT